MTSLVELMIRIDSLNLPLGTVTQALSLSSRRVGFCFQCTPTAVDETAVQHKKKKMNIHYAQLQRTSLEQYLVLVASESRLGGLAGSLAPRAVDF